MFWFAVSPPVWVGLIANLNWIGNKEYFSWYWKWYVYFQAENLASLVLGYLMLPFLIIFQSYYTYLVFFTFSWQVNWIIHGESGYGKFYYGDSSDVIE